MTFSTQRKIIRNIPMVFTTDVCPMEVSFHSLGNLIQSTKNAVVSFSQSTTNPRVVGTIGCVTSFPEIVSGIPSSYSMAFSTTESNISTRYFMSKSTGTYWTSNNFSSLSSDITTRFRAVDSPDPALMGRESLFAYSTCQLYHKIIIH